jgi:hypothetical protein
MRDGSKMGAKRNGKVGYPTPRVFWAKSVRFHEKKRVDIFASAKEFARI